MNIHVILLLNDVSEKMSALGQGIKGIVERTGNRPVIHSQAEVLSAQADYIRAQTEGVRIDNRKKGILTDVLAAASVRLLEDLNSEGRPVNPSPTLPIERLTQMLDRDLLPGLRELQERNFEVEVGGDEDGGDTDSDT